jgi:hypothetical protein
VSALAAEEPTAVARLSRVKWERAVKASSSLSWHRRGQALALAELMRADGALERYEDEIGEHLADPHGRSLSGAGVRRLLMALRLAGLLSKVMRSSPAGPPIFVARSPLMIAKVSDVHRSDKRQCSPVSGDVHQASGDWASELRKRRKLRARVLSRSSRPPTDPVSARGEPPDAACCAHCSRRAGAAGATGPPSATVVPLQRPPTRGVDLGRPRDDHETEVP